MKISFLSGLLKFSRSDHSVLLLGLFSILCGKCFLFLQEGKIFFLHDMAFVVYTYPFLRTPGIPLDWNFQFNLIVNLMIPHPPGMVDLNTFLSSVF